MTHPRKSGLESSTSSPVIVATDGREQSDGALRAGALFGELMGEWRIVSAAPMIYNFAPGLDLGVTAEAIDVLRDQQRQSVDAQIRRVLGKEVDIEVDVATGNPAEVVTGAAARANASLRAQLIAVGTRGQGFIARLLLGSVATKVVRASPIPVLVFPPKEEVPASAATS